MMHYGDRFKDGLAICKVGKCLEENPNGWRSLFVHGDDCKLTATQVTQLFKPHFSPEGSNKRSRENLTVSYWRDWLLEVEGCSKTLTDNLLLGAWWN